VLSAIEDDVVSNHSAFADRSALRALIEHADAAFALACRIYHAIQRSQQRRHRVDLVLVTLFVGKEVVVLVSVADDIRNCPAQVGSPLKWKRPS
jgi:hypothetical protein